MKNNVSVVKPFAGEVIILLLLATLLLTSCKKDPSCTECRENNKPPVAIAGPDQLITLPTDSVLLDGSNSSDPDGGIRAWQWTKIEGPASFVIDNATAPKTLVQNLKAGVYQFELNITDTKGLSARDTVLVTVDAVLTNHPPVANAGADQVITAPADTVTLDGSTSMDPDNNITSYVWTKVAGPSSFIISNANAVQTQATMLVQGIYQFELKATDAGGLFSKDTVQITVESSVVSTACDNSNRLQVNARLVPVGTLSQAWSGGTIAAASNKILLAGNSTVEIYDLVTNTSSIAKLSVPRYLITAVAAGNKVFFGGGEISDGTWPVNTVDIYDVSTNTWATASLSVPGHSIAAAAVGNKVLFAGGDGGFSGPGREKTVDIYDLTTNTWSTTRLQEAKRGGHTAITVNNKVYFAGGEGWPDDPVPGTWFASARIDIYDNATNAWSTARLHEGKLYFAGIAVGDKIYWAGGMTGAYPSIHLSCEMEIMDINNGNSSVQYLSRPAWGQNAIVKDNKIIFYGGSDTTKFDIYDIATNAWSIGVLPVQGATLISVNNTVYAILAKRVWKLEF